MFYYLENKRLDGTFRQLAKARLYPVSAKAQRPDSSSRYLYSKKCKLFAKIGYRIPYTHTPAFMGFKELACPLPIVYYLFIEYIH